MQVVLGKEETQGISHVCQQIIENAQQERRDELN